MNCSTVLIYDAASQLVGITETDTATPAATTAWQFAYDAAGNVVKSRMAPGEIAQQPIAWSGGLAAGDATIDWDEDGQTERYDLISNVSVLPGDVVEIVATASGFSPTILLQRASEPGIVWYEGGIASRTATIADSWTIALSARDELAAGGYDIRIVKNTNSIVPTALVEYDFTYDKAGNLTAATEDRFAVAQFGGLGPAASGLGITTAYTVNALNQVVGYRHIDTANKNAVTKRAVHTYRADGTVGTVTRFAGAGANPIGTSTAAYDGMGRLTGITHAPRPARASRMPTPTTRPAASRR